MKQWSKWLAAGLVAGFGVTALPSQAAEWNFYGSARVKTWYEWTESADGKTFASGDEDDTDFDIGMQANSRVGAKVKVDDKVSGWGELGVSDKDVTLRHLIGNWDFEWGTLTIGQTRTPIGRQDSLRAHGDDAGLTAFGEPYLGRRPLIQMESHGLKLALVKPHSITNIYNNTNTTSETDNMMPRIELSWQQTMGIASFDAFGGYHTYTIDSTAEDFDVDSYMVGAGFWLKPDPGYLRGIGYYARNARQFGQFISPQPATFGSAKITDEGGVVDNDVFGGAVFSGYKINSRLSAEIGYGYIQSEDDAPGADTVKWQCFYAQAPITLYKGITVTPEAGVMEDIDSGQRITYAGAKWQANF